MRRLLHALLMIVLLACAGGAALAQDDSAPISPIPADALRVLVNARTDLELLAQEYLGNERPLGWSGSLDINDASLVVLVRLDLELLAGQMLSSDTRPPGWFGAVAGSAYLTASDIRHDLELLADNMMGAGGRPDGWSGGEPIARCDRATQNLAYLAQTFEGWAFEGDSTALDFCQQAAQQLAQFDAAALNARASAPISAPAGQGGGSGLLRALGDDTYGYLDRSATQRIGVIPIEETFTALARSYTPFSRMTLVQGNGFQVYVDWKTTTMTEAEFWALPNVREAGADPVCNVVWCRFTLLSPNGGRRNREGLRPVSGGSHMRIHYDGDLPEGALVRMEVCRRRTSANNPECSPATSVVLEGGTVLPPSGNSGGLLQFVMPYGYSLARVESACCYTTEVYISTLQERKRG